VKILLGIGGTEDSFAALEETLVHARSAGDELTVAVLDNPETDLEYPEIRRRVEDAAREHDVGVRVIHLTGHPGGSLVEEAETGGYDRIVLGGGHRSPMGKFWVGHIAEFVLLNSRVSVTLVR